MSLDADQRRRTSDELTDNYVRSGLTAADVQRDLGLSPDELTAVLAMAPDSDPRTVWILRDHLVASVLANGGQPRAFTSLTEDARSDARGWFGISDRSPQQSRPHRPEA